VDSLFDHILHAYTGNADAPHPGAPSHQNDDAWEDLEKGRPTGMLTSSRNTSRMTPVATTSLPFWSNSKLDKSFMNTLTDLAISADNAGIQWDSMGWSFKPEPFFGDLL
jgi:hypothetical protein